MHTKFKFTAEPSRKQRDVRTEKIATKVSIAAGVVAFLTMGAGWPILIAGILTYLTVRFMMRRRN